jgi:hypothetical protein
VAAANSDRRRFAVRFSSCGGCLRFSSLAEPAAVEEPATGSSSLVNICVADAEKIIGGGGVDCVGLVIWENLKSSCQ